MKARFTQRILSLIAVLVGVFYAPVAQAQIPTLLPSCTTTGNCTLCDFITLAGNVSQMILSLIGIVVLGMVVLGGFMWLVSAGSSDRIQKGKSIITGAFIGLGITLGGYLAVNAVVVAFLGNVGGDGKISFSDTQIFGEDWTQFCESDAERRALNTCENSNSPDEENWGQACSNASCNDANNCKCGLGQCITSCAFAEAEALSSDNSAGVSYECVKSAEDCTVSEGQSKTAIYGSCTIEAPFCCIKVDSK